MNLTFGPIVRLPDGDSAINNPNSVWRVYDTCIQHESCFLSIVLLRSRKSATALAPLEWSGLKAIHPLGPEAGSYDKRAHQLVRQHEDCLEGEFSVAKVEEVLQTGPQQIQHHDIVVPFNAIPPDARDPGCKGCENNQLL